MNFPYGDTITLHSRAVTGQDSTGNDIYGTTDSTILGAFAAAGSTFLVQGQLTAITHDTVYLPPGTVVSVADTMTIRGLTYGVDGTPFEWRNPFTGTDFGVEVRLQGVTG